jgi:predicted DNA-binding transcriptional regulator AlpA
MTEKPKQTLNEREAAEIIGASPKTLRNWRVKGCGPRFIKAGSKLVRYRLPDILVWQEANVRSSTSGR